MKILIVDDHPVFRRGLKEVLSKVPDFAPVVEAESGRRTLEMVRKERWDAVVLDVSLPDKSGIDILKELKQERPKLPVLMLSTYPEDQYAIRALRAGAAGYLTKEKTPDEIVAALRKVLGGGKYVSASLAERLALEIEAGTARLPHESLSDREYQIMRMIASGKSVKEIAGSLFLSVRTVHTYRTRVMEKLQVKTNGEVIRYALDHKLVD